MAPDRWTVLRAAITSEIDAYTDAALDAADAGGAALVPLLDHQREVVDRLLDHVARFDTFGGAPG